MNDISNIKAESVNLIITEEYLDWYDDLYCKNEITARMSYNTTKCLFINNTDVELKICSSYVYDGDTYIVTHAQTNHSKINCTHGNCKSISYNYELKAVPYVK